MIRSVEFDLVTKSEANQRFASRAGMFAKSERVKRQRAEVTAVLASTFGAVVPPRHVQTGASFVVNRIEVKLARLAPGTLDDDNLRGALKAVRDAVARWIGVDDRDPLVSWSYAQEQAAQHVYRVRLEIADRSPGDPRKVVLAETASAGRAAKSRIKREVGKAKKMQDGIKKAGRVLTYQPEAGARAASSAARSKAEQSFAKLTAKASPETLRDVERASAAIFGKPTALDLRDAAERLLTPKGGDANDIQTGRERGSLGASGDKGSMNRPGDRTSHPAPGHRDPGEERPARDLAPCTTCGVGVGWPCQRLAVDGSLIDAPMIHGVHLGRAKEAGINGVRLPPRAPTNGHRRIVTPPVTPAYVRLPWEQCPCSDVEIDEPGPHVAGCPWSDPDFDGPTQMKIKRDARHDGEDAPAQVVYTVPAEHRARFGDRVTLTRRRTTLPKLGDVWLYE